MQVPIVGIPPKPHHKITNKQQLLSVLIFVLANMRKWVAIKDKNVTCRNLSYIRILYLHIIYFL